MTVQELYNSSQSPALVGIFVEDGELVKAIKLPGKWKLTIHRDLEVTSLWVSWRRDKIIAMQKLEDGSKLSTEHLSLESDHVGSYVESGSTLVYKQYTVGFSLDQGESLLTVYSSERAIKAETSRSNGLICDKAVFVKNHSPNTLYIGAYDEDYKNKLAYLPPGMVFYDGASRFAISKDEKIYQTIKLPGRNRVSPWVIFYPETLKPQEAGNESIFTLTPDILRTIAVRLIRTLLLQEESLRISKTEDVVSRIKRIVETLFIDFLDSGRTSLSSIKEVNIDSLILEVLNEWRN